MIRRVFSLFWASQKDPLCWGVFSLLASSSLAAKYFPGFGGLCLAFLGTFLSFQSRKKGSFLFLALGSILGAVFFALQGEGLFWQLGLALSFALGFLILSLGFDQRESFLFSLQSQLKTSRSTTQNLEEALEKNKEEIQELQIGFQEKASCLQKELEELQAEHSSILILNEVLRTKTAAHLEKRAFLEESLGDEKREQDLLRAELSALEKEMKRLRDHEPLVLQNKELMKELNEARYEKEQTHLINETLVRLHSKEFFKAKEFQEEAFSLKDLLRAAHKEIQRVQEPFQEEIALLKKEQKRLHLEFEKASQEAHRGREYLEKFEQIQTERNFLKERLSLASQELELQKQKTAKVELIEEKHLHVEKEKIALEQKIRSLMEEIQKKKVDPEIDAKVQKLSEIEPLFKQLKQQFEERQEVLHRTRSELFQAETEKKRLQIEKERLDTLALPKEIEQELEGLYQKAALLEEENRELEELVSHLMQLSTQRKKKVKNNSPEGDQVLLF